MPSSPPLPPSATRPCHTSCWPKTECGKNNELNTANSIHLITNLQVCVDRCACIYIYRLIAGLPAPTNYIHAMTNIDLQFCADRCAYLESRFLYSYLQDRCGPPWRRLLEAPWGLVQLCGSCPVDFGSIFGLRNKREAAIYIYIYTTHKLRT